MANGAHNTDHIAAVRSSSTNPMSNMILNFLWCHNVLGSYEDSTQYTSAYMHDLIYTPGRTIALKKHDSV